MYYYGARYYAPWLCRFVSTDPLAAKYAYYSPYQYAGNKPINKVDIDGLEEDGATPTGGEGGSDNIGGGNDTQAWKDAGVAEGSSDGTDYTNMGDGWGDDAEWLYNGGGENTTTESTDTDFKINSSNFNTFPSEDRPVQLTDKTLITKKEDTSFGAYGPLKFGSGPSQLEADLGVVDGSNDPMNAGADAPDAVSYALTVDIAWWSVDIGITFVPGSQSQQGGIGFAGSIEDVIGTPDAGVGFSITTTNFKKGVDHIDNVKGESTKFGADLGVVNLDTGHGYNSNGEEISDINQITYGLGAAGSGIKLGSTATWFPITW